MEKLEKLERLEKLREDAETLPLELQDLHEEVVKSARVKPKLLPKVKPDTKRLNVER